MPNPSIMINNVVLNRKTDVIVDFIFDSGLFYISIKNISRETFFKVSISFDKKFTGINGRKAVSELPLFKNIEFLAPEKEIKTFLDTSASYFSRKEPERMISTISYENSAGQKVIASLTHDLSIYREIGYVVSK